MIKVHPAVRVTMGLTGAVLILIPDPATTATGLILVSVAFGVDEV